MMTDWIKHLKTAEERKEFAQVLGNSSIVLNRLRELVAEYLKQLDDRELAMDQYDCPSWSHKQAHINGRRQELQQLQRLLTL